MKVVIDIPEDDILAIKYLKEKGWASRHELLILNATPLEKVLEDIKAEITNERDNKGFCVWYYDDLMKKIDSHISGKERE